MRVSRILAIPKKPRGKNLSTHGKIFTGGWQNFYRGVAKFCHNNIYIIYLKYRDIIYTRFARKKSPSRFPFGKQKTHSKSDTAKQNRRQNLHQGKERKKNSASRTGNRIRARELEDAFLSETWAHFPLRGNRKGREICFGFRARAAPAVEKKLIEGYYFLVDFCPSMANISPLR